MKFYIFCITVLSGFALLSFKDDGQDSNVFLSINYKHKIALYSTTTKKKVIKLLGHNFKKEDYLLFTIYKSNDSMYYVEASHAIGGNNIKGWISKNTELSIFSKSYNKKIFFYKFPNRKTTGISIDYTPQELRVLDCKNGWLKVRTIINNKNISGWIPPEEQCSNPYTTCS